jgi:hypothetical protein
MTRTRQEILHTVRRAPLRAEAQNLAQRFRDHGRYYFTFLERPGVEPTNNGIERQFRFLIVDRKVTQALGVKQAVAGANGFGLPWRPVPNVPAARLSI